ncbi:MAG: hypothetical protein JXB42_09870 [Deltaproteobacteria bacterium]|nr:hypothetical protein [Deltaproteobacteria bacterium]
MKKITIVVLLVFVASALMLSVGFAETLKGKDFVRLGKIVQLNGTLIETGHEWSLRHNDSVYNLHLGPSDFWSDKGIILKDGENASLRGFIHEKDVAVTVIETGGKSATLRDDEGRPAWAGTRFSRGNGKS